MVERTEVVEIQPEMIYPDGYGPNIPPPPVPPNYGHMAG